MVREKFSIREVTEVVGEYPELDCGRVVIPAQPKYYRPITPRENLKLFLSGQTPYWIPMHGKLISDIQLLRPRINPDNIAKRMLFDGGGPYDFKGSNKSIGLFDVEWIFVPSAGGSMTDVKNPKVPDITRWEEYIQFPNMDEWDWENFKKVNVPYLDSTDKLRELSIPCGFFERLMSLCEVEDAVIALIDEEQQDGVHRFFDKLADFYIDYIDRVVSCVEIDMVLLHDDWGHQRGAFFSDDTAREMIMPYIKRVFDHCHKLGLFIELHSCGKNEIFVPTFIEMGVDLWCGQNINDFDMLMEKYKGRGIYFGVDWSNQPADHEMTAEEVRELARQWTERYQFSNILGYFVGAPKGFAEAVYEFSRKKYEEA